MGVGDRWWVSICIMYRNIYNLVELEIFAGCKISNHPANFDWSVEREQVEILKSLRFVVILPLPPFRIFELIPANYVILLRG